MAARHSIRRQLEREAPLEVRSGVRLGNRRRQEERGEDWSPSPSPPPRRRRVAGGSGTARSPCLLLSRTPSPRPTTSSRRNQGAATSRVQLSDGAGARGGQASLSHYSNGRPLTPVMHQELELDGEATIPPRLDIPPRRIHSLPVQNITQDKLPLSCPICSIEFSLNERITFTKCNHYYHTQCLVDWAGQCAICLKCPVTGLNTILSDIDHFDIFPTCKTCKLMINYHQRVIQTRCNHYFHANCMYTLMDFFTACTVCRTPLFD